MLQIENEDVVDNALKKKIAHAFGVINIELSARAARRLRGASPRARCRRPPRFEKPNRIVKINLLD